MAMTPEPCTPAIRRIGLRFCVVALAIGSGALWLAVHCMALWMLVESHASLAAWESPLAPGEFLRLLLANALLIAALGLYVIQRLSRWALRTVSWIEEGGANGSDRAAASVAASRGGCGRMPSSQ